MGIFMTPGINAAKKAGVFYRLHEYEHDSNSASYGLEAAEKLSIPESRVFKTLVVNLDNQQLAVGVIPVSSMLSMKHMAKATSTKKAVMASQSEVERSTGYVLGGVSPLGQKRRHKTVVDKSATLHQTIFVSAGRRGLEIELRPEDLIALVNGAFADLSQ